MKTSSRTRLSTDPNVLRREITSLQTRVKANPKDTAARKSIRVRNDRIAAIEHDAKQQPTFQSQRQNIPPKQPSITDAMASLTQQIQGLTVGELQRNPAIRQAAQELAATCQIVGSAAQSGT